MGLCSLQQCPALGIGAELVLDGVGKQKDVCAKAGGFGSLLFLLLLLFPAEAPGARDGGSEVQVPFLAIQRAPSRGSLGVGSRG